MEELPSCSKQISTATAALQKLSSAFALLMVKSANVYLVCVFPDLFLFCKFLRSFDLCKKGVETVTIDGQKITVVGKVDPAKLRDKVEQKTHNKVELISPQPKKDGGEKENAKGKDSGGGDGKKEKKKENNGKKSDDKSDQKASKEKEVKIYLI